LKWKGLLLPVAAVLAAEGCARTFGIQSDSLASPSQILSAAWALLRDGSLFAMLGQTLLAALGGLLIGGGTGLVMALVLGLSPLLSQLLRPPIEALRPIPSIAILPVLLMIFGFGYRLEIANVSFACFWPSLIIGQAAISGIEPRLLEVSRVLGLGFWGRVTKIVIPAALPRLFVAFRLAASVALIVAVTVEIALNPQGMGYELMSAESSLRPEAMFAILLYIGLTGWSVNAVLLLAQRRLFGRAAALPGAASGETP
jgi:ABC-type nitrate/sulfonate/bicarbonate transport system permease component